MPVPAAAVPNDRNAIAIHTAHRLSDVITNLAYASGRLRAARSSSGDLQQYHTSHAAAHVQRALDAAHALADNLRRHYPREGAELDALSKAISLARALSEDAGIATTAHLAESVVHHTAHGTRHIRAMLTPDGSDALYRFNHKHAVTHVSSALDHARRLAGHLADNPDRYPHESRHLARLPVTVAPPRGY